MGWTAKQSAFPEDPRGAGAEDGLLIERYSAFELFCEFARLYAAMVSNEGSGDGMALGGSSFIRGLFVIMLTA